MHKYTTMSSTISGFTSVHQSAIIIILSSCVVVLALTEVSSLCAGAQESCRACIRAHPHCSWCADRKEINELSFMRCRIHLDNALVCNNTIHPENEIEATQNLNFSETVDSLNAAKGDAVQFKPQAASLKLRIGEPLKLNISFKKVIDYPLDLYYTMDLSYSMKDDLEILQTLGINLVDDIRGNVTKNVNLGFGTFVDKLVLPYATDNKEMFDNLCSGNCQPTFGFRHQLSITSNGSLFKDVVASTIISANLDEPEGGFDALMQIAACTDVIGWRKDALHVIVLTSDAPSHCAMDGKLAGILEKNDMKCHLEEDMQNPGTFTYSKSRSQDYPSVGQLREILEQNKVQTVFAVTSDVLDVYEGLQSLLPATIETLESDSGNILSVISSAYDEIKSHFQMVSPDFPDTIHASFRILCPGATKWEENSLKCDHVDLGDHVTFQLELTANVCPTNPAQVDIAYLTSNSISEQVQLSFEYHCECNCDSTTLENSESCSYEGDLQCGVCACKSGKSGSHCQCLSSATTSQLEKNCTDPSPRAQDLDALCNNNGICECGICRPDDCFEGYQGNYCQCRARGCPTDESGLECGGEMKGVCTNCYENGECVCNSTGGWFLSAETGTCICNLVECKRSIDDAQVCSGHGKCECRDCVCDNNSLVWEGKYCEKCIHPNCNPLDATCESEVLQHCVECVYSHAVTEHCTELCQNLNISVKTLASLPDCSSSCAVSTDEVCKDCGDFNNEVFEPIDCLVSFTPDQCMTSYKIGWDKIQGNYGVFVRMRNPDQDCPKPIEPLYIVLSVAGGVVGIGVIIVGAYICSKYRKDKRKYQAFLQEVQRGKSRMNINPIHEPATRRIRNPTFNPENAESDSE